jgi:hypothetical protein
MITNDGAALSYGTLQILSAAAGGSVHIRRAVSFRVMNTGARCAASPGLALPGCLMRLI